MVAVAALVLMAAATASAKRPNVVLIVTDDQTLEMMNRRVMPKAHRLLVRRGTSFTQAIVSTPQCCPSRATMLTGQYSRNNGVVSNRPGYALLDRKRRVLPVWLRSAGYRTIHIGKFLNGYTGFAGFDAAPGWSVWKTLTAADYESPVFAIDGRRRGPVPKYLTTVLNRMARAAIRRHAGGRRPFYLQLDHLAPHVGSGRESGRCRGLAIPRPRDAARFRAATAPRNPATEEQDLSDKPEFIQRQAPLDAEDRQLVDRRYSCALGSLREVDRGIGEMVRALRETGELRDTLIAFISDNGYSFGEHRVPFGKGLAYEEHLRVPLIVRPPRGHRIDRRARRGLRLDAPVANVDLAPTILDIAGAAPCKRGRGCRRMDGRSLLPLLGGGRPRWARSRAIRTGFEVNAGLYARSCAWDGLRTPRRAIVEHTSVPVAGGNTCEPTSQWESYDLAADPFQLQGDRPVSDRLTDRLGALRRCSGIRGRDPRITGRPFCE